MNCNLHPTGRTLTSDQAFACNLDGGKYRNYQFLRLVAVKKRFTNCDFSFTAFDSCYLRNCIFDSCDFTGCIFTNSNLRGAKFVGCKFDYAQFENTQVEPEILGSGCPGQENLQQKFARTLRTNFHQLGDAPAANKAIKIELQATRVHLKKAWNSRESYYRKKYPGRARIRMFFEWLEFVGLDLFWGNGESPLKLLRSIVVLVAIIALGDAILVSDPSAFQSYEGAALRAPAIFLGVITPKEFSDIALAALAAIRYVMIACFVSILIKRLSKR